jgi:3-phosphoshikimate 1-carboxyvinyltransferase
MGVDVISRNGYLPLTIKGSICPGVIKLDGSQSSQFVTGVLIVAPLLSGESHIKVTKLQSKPYIEMTLLAMQHFGIRVRHSGFRSFYVVGNQSYKSRSYFVEGDWSAAAFHLVGGAISGEVYLKGLNVYSAQGDRSILPLLKQVGADIEVSQNQIVVRKGKLCSFSFDASDCPDLFPPLVILAAACNGKSIIKGVQRLFNKECDRAEVLKIEMSKIGIRIEINGDFMYVYGGKQITGGVIYSHNDHRIAMAGAIAATIANDTIYVDNHECVQKSYPSFFSDLETITTKRF